MWFENLIGKGFVKLSNLRIHVALNIIRDNLRILMDQRNNEIFIWDSRYEAIFNKVFENCNSEGFK